MSDQDERIKCVKCGEKRVRDDFYDDKVRKSGKRAQCIPCDQEERRQRMTPRGRGVGKGYGRRLIDGARILKGEY